MSPLTLGPQGLDEIATTVRSWIKKSIKTNRAPEAPHDNQNTTIGIVSALLALRVF